VKEVAEISKEFDDITSNPIQFIPKGSKIMKIGVLYKLGSKTGL
jgi:hypothetical protein